MKALILTAGFGNRMRPLTNKTHKTLIKIAGIPIIDRIINSLVKNNINKIVIVTGYMADEIIKHLKTNFPSIEFEFIHNIKYDQTNNIYSMALAFEKMKIDDELLIIESDLIFNDSVINAAINSKHENLALVSPYKTGMDGTVVQISNDRITNIYPPHLQDENFNLFDKFKTLNIYKFSEEFCKTDFKKILIYYAKAIDDNCYYELILGILIYMQRKEIFSEIIPNNSWAEVDDPNDLAVAEYMFNSSNRLDELSKSFGGYWNFELLDFCFIRNMHFPTKNILSEMKSNLPGLLENYGSRQSILNLKLSYVLEQSSENICLLNGASQIYPILKIFCKGMKWLIPAPTFGEYNNFNVNQQYTDDVGFDLDEINSKINDSEILLFVNPNNPTGSILKTNYIYDVASQNKHKLIIVDESFIDFSEEQSITKILEKSDLENIIVIKSLSKVLGLPGIRLGYIYTKNSEFMNFVRQNIPIWNSNSVAEHFLEILLKNKKSLKDSFLKTKIDRKEFIDKMRSLDIFENIFESNANFFIVEYSKLKSIQKKIILDEELINKYNIYIKNVTNKFISNHSYRYRVAVRSFSDNMRLIHSLIEITR
jgi:histidinol-phosphate/aromatic aminotransferase/cobyric acid decarboxylase-like protein/choline kinase